RLQNAVSLPLASCRSSSWSADGDSAMVLLAVFQAPVIHCAAGGNRSILFCGRKTKFLDRKVISASVYSNCSSLPTPARATPARAGDPGSAMNVLKARDSYPTTRKPRVAGDPAREPLDADTASGSVFQTEPLPQHIRRTALFSVIWCRRNRVF